MEGSKENIRAWDSTKADGQRNNTPSANRVQNVTILSKSCKSHTSGEIPADVDV